MLKLRILKGYVLLETVVSLSLVTIFMYIIFLLQFKIVKLNYFNNRLEQDINNFELFTSYAESGESFENLKSMKGVSPMYVNCNEMNFETMLNSDLSKMIDTHLENDNNAIQINVTGDEILKLDMKLKVYFDNTVENIHYVNYRAPYE